MNRILNWLLALLGEHPSDKCQVCGGSLRHDHDPGTVVESTCRKCGNIIWSYDK